MINTDNSTLYSPPVVVSVSSETETETETEL